MKNRLFLKSVILYLFTFSLLLNSFAQADSLVENHNAETLWYLQKETWMAGLILLVIILGGFFFRLSKYKKSTSKTIIKETTETTSPKEYKDDPDSIT